MNVTDPENPDPPAPPQKVGRLVVRPGFTTRPAPAILIREYSPDGPGAGVEIDVLGVYGVDLDATLERIRAKLERYTAVIGRSITIYPLGHPDAPSGYLAIDAQAWEIRKALGADGDQVRTDAEGRW